MRQGDRAGKTEEVTETTGDLAIRCGGSKSRLKDARIFNQWCYIAEESPAVALVSSSAKLSKQKTEVV